MENKGNANFSVTPAHLGGVHPGSFGVINDYVSWKSKQTGERSHWAFNPFPGFEKFCDVIIGSKGPRHSITETNFNMQVGLAVYYIEQNMALKRIVANMLDPLRAPLSGLAAGTKMTENEQKKQDLMDAESIKEVKDKMAQANISIQNHWEIQGLLHMWRAHYQGSEYRGRFSKDLYREILLSWKSVRDEIGELDQVAVSWLDEWLKRFNEFYHQKEDWVQHTLCWNLIHDVGDADFGPRTIRRWPLEINRFRYRHRSALSIASTILGIQERINQFRAMIKNPQPYHGWSEGSWYWSVRFEEFKVLVNQRVDLEFRERLQYQPASLTKFHDLDRLALAAFKDQMFESFKTQRDPTPYATHLIDIWCTTFYFLVNYDMICTGYAWSWLRSHSVMDTDCFILTYEDAAEGPRGWESQTTKEHIATFLTGLKAFIKRRMQSQRKRNRKVAAKVKQTADSVSSQSDAGEGSSEQKPVEKPPVKQLDSPETPRERIDKIKQAVSDLLANFTSSCEFRDREIREHSTGEVASSRVQGGEPAPTLRETKAPITLRSKVNADTNRSIGQVMEGPNQDVVHPTQDRLFDNSGTFSREGTGAETSETTPGLTPPVGGLAIDLFEEVEVSSQSSESTIDTDEHKGKDIEGEIRRPRRSAPRQGGNRDERSHPTSRPPEPLFRDTKVPLLRPTGAAGSAQLQKDLTGRLDLQGRLSASTPQNTAKSNRYTPLAGTGTLLGHGSEVSSISTGYIEPSDGPWTEVGRKKRKPSGNLRHQARGVISNETYPETAARIGSSGGPEPEKPHDHHNARTSANTSYEGKPLGRLGSSRSEQKGPQALSHNPDTEASLRTIPKPTKPVQAKENHHPEVGDLPIPLNTKPAALGEESVSIRVEGSDQRTKEPKATPTQALRRKGKKHEGVIDLLDPSTYTALVGSRVGPEMGAASRGTSPGKKPARQRRTIHDRYIGSDGAVFSKSTTQSEDPIPSSPVENIATAEHLPLGSRVRANSEQKAVKAIPMTGSRIKQLESSSSNISLGKKTDREIGESKSRPITCPDGKHAQADMFPEEIADNMIGAAGRLPHSKGGIASAKASSTHGMSKVLGPTNVSAEIIQEGDLNARIPAPVIVTTPPNIIIGRPVPTGYAQMQTMEGTIRGVEFRGAGAITASEAPIARAGGSTKLNTGGVGLSTALPNRGTEGNRSETEPPKVHKLSERDLEFYACYAPSDHPGQATRGQRHAKEVRPSEKTKLEPKNTVEVLLERTSSVNTKNLLTRRRTSSAPEVSIDDDEETEDLPFEEFLGPYGVDWSQSGANETPLPQPMLEQWLEYGERRLVKQRKTGSPKSDSEVAEKKQDILTVLESVGSSDIRAPSLEELMEMQRSGTTVNQGSRGSRGVPREEGRHRNGRSEEDSTEYIGYDLLAKGAEGAVSELLKEWYQARK